MQKGKFSTVLESILIHFNVKENPVIGNGEMFYRRVVKMLKNYLFPGPEKITLYREAFIRAFCRYG